MSAMLEKFFGCEIKGVDLDKHQVTALASTAAIDRDNEIILPDGWMLDGFKRNSLFLWNHQHRTDDPQNVLGSVVSVDKTPAGLQAVFEYDVAINPKAKLVFEQVKKGTLKGFSVGFLPKSWVTENSPQEHKRALPDFAREALDSGKAFVVYTSADLLEISQVPIPSNPQALVGAKSARLAELKKLEAPETMELKGMTPTDALMALVGAQPDFDDYHKSLCTADRELLAAAAHTIELRTSGAKVLEQLATLEPEHLAQAMDAMDTPTRRYVADVVCAFR